MDSKESTYTNKSYKELKELAVDLAEGKIFSNLHLGEQHHMFQSVFMVMVFMKQEDIDQMIANDIHFFYEYMNQAGPMSINGMPNFFSVRMLNKKDFHDMWIEYEKYVAMRTEFLEDYQPSLPVEFSKMILTDEDLEKYRK